MLRKVMREDDLTSVQEGTILMKIDVKPPALSNILVFQTKNLLQMQHFVTLPFYRSLKVSTQSPIRMCRAAGWDRGLVAS